MKKITFGSVDEYFFEDKEVHPQPIKQYIPDWFKQMGQRIDDAYVGAPNYENKNKAKTIKACPSFVELWDEGFVIPAPCDYILQWIDGELFWRTRATFDQGRYDQQEVTNHWNSQMVDGLPKESDARVIVKLNLPYKVFTPKGYSIRQHPYPYSFIKEWTALEGVLRSDKIHSVNIQIFLNTDEEVVIKKGDPLCLYIPYKRELFKADMIDLNKDSKISKLYKKHSFQTYSLFKFDMKGYLNED